MQVPVGSRVFISYTHDSDAHRERVRKLADQLVYEGLDCWCDQYVEDGAPERGWPMWMEENIRAAEYVLMVCTELYLKRYEGREAPRKGLGAKFESVLLTQDMYENDGKNRKIIPVVFDDKDVAFIPAPFKPFTRYYVDKKTGYEELYARLTKQNGPGGPTIGALRPLVLPIDVDTSSVKVENVNDKEPVATASIASHLPVIPEFTDDMHPNLKIAQAFFGQSVTKRFRIASDLHLLEAGETIENVNEEEVSTKILLRAKAKGILAELWSRLFDEKLDPNPFH